MIGVVLVTPPTQVGPIPADARHKPASGSQRIAFVPSVDLVVTPQTDNSGQWQFAEYLRRACGAVVEPDKVPKDSS